VFNQVVLTFMRKHDRGSEQPSQPAVN
jgi:hypothetical protein